MTDSNWWKTLSDQVFVRLLLCINEHEVIKISSKQCASIVHTVIILCCFIKANEMLIFSVFHIATVHLGVNTAAVLCQYDS